MPDGPSFGRRSGGKKKKKKAATSQRTPAARGDDISRLTAAELRGLLTDRGLPTGGTKPDLLGRLEAHIAGATVSPRPQTRRPRAATAAPPTPNVDEMRRAEVERRLQQAGLSSDGTLQQIRATLRGYLDGEAEQIAAVTGFAAASQQFGASPTPAPGRTRQRASAADASARALQFSPPSTASSTSSFASVRGASPSNFGAFASPVPAASPRSARRAPPPIPGSAASAPSLTSAASAARSAASAARASPAGSAASAARAFDSSDSEDQSSDDEGEDPLPGAVRDLVAQLRNQDDGLVVSRDLIPLRRAAKKFPLIAREVADGRYDKGILLDERRARLLERKLEADENAERREGRDFDATFATRRAQPVDVNEAAIIAAHSAPGPIAGLRVWQRPQFADVKFVQQEESLA